MITPSPAVGKPAKPAPVAPKTVPAKSPTDATHTTKQYTLNRGVARGSHKVVIYGAGGIGKSELASLVAGVGFSPVFIDIEEGSSFLDVARVEPTPQTFQELLDAIRAAQDMGNVIVIDSFTKAEELAVAHTLLTVPHEKGNFVTSIEGYGFGKGYIHVYETFLKLLQSLDTVVRGGRHVIATCHDCTANVPNPSGEDFIRYEPRLQSPASGKGSIRHRVKEWCDHLFFLGYDTYVNKDGKASGSGSRTIYPAEMPTHWAKSRLLSEPIPYAKGDVALWRQLFT
jgi:hypothetical protein